MHLKLLVPHFFRQFFSAEQLTDSDEPLLGIGQILGILATPMLFWSLYLAPKYVDLTVRPALAHLIPAEIRSDQAFFLTASMLVLGLLALVNWDTLFPNITDYNVLMPLPLSMRTIFLAKAASLGLLLVIATAVWNGLSILCFPFAIGQGLRAAAGHLVAIVLASAFTFFAIVAIQGFLSNILPYRTLRAVTRILQFVLLVALLSALFSVPTLVRRDVPEWLPPLWFQGVWQSIAGGADRSLVHLAPRAWQATGLALLAVAASYTLSYFRHVRKTLEALPGRESGPGLVIRSGAWLANNIYVRNPAQRAAFYFTLLGISRSGRHRVYLSAYAALAAALLLDDSRELLVAPTVTFLLLAGLRHIAVVPIDLRANWLFRVGPASDPLQYRIGTRKAVFLVAILPIHLACAAAGVPLAPTAHSLFLSLVLMEIFFFSLKKIPFTCSWLPGRSNMILLSTLFIGGFLVYTTALAGAQEWATRLGHRWLMLYFLPGIVLGLLWRRDTPALEFEDRLEPAVLELSLSK